MINSLVHQEKVVYQARGSVIYGLTAMMVVMKKIAQEIVSAVFG